jgi:ubiquitin C-terminal hydrolase
LFQGYQQHDSHELLAFLLDGVHEDLNRVHDKKFVDMEGMSEAMDDKERAKAMWQKHELRNRSVIVDLFQVKQKRIFVCVSRVAGWLCRRS